MLFTFNRGPWMALISYLYLAAMGHSSSDWMKKIPGEKRLSELTILGTHNSCALHGGDYGQCQSLGLREQLELGVRFLDIRCQWRKGDLHIVHGIVDQKMLFSEVVEICEDFLKEFPSETIMMSVMEQSSRWMKQGDFGKAFKKIIGGRNGEWFCKKEIPKLENVRGKVVVVSRNREVDGIPWSSFRIQDSFRIRKGNTLDDKWNKVKKHFSGVDVEGEASINFINCTGIFNPPNFTANILNEKLKGYLGKRKGDVLGVLLVDFVTEEISDLVMAGNR